MARLDWRRVNNEKLIRERGSEPLEPKGPPPPSTPWVPVQQPDGSKTCPAGCGKHIAVEYLRTHLARCSFNIPKSRTGPKRSLVPQKRCSKCGALVNENHILRHARRCPERHIGRRNKT